MHNYPLLDFRFDNFRLRITSSNSLYTGERYDVGIPEAGV